MRKRILPVFAMVVPIVPVPGGAGGAAVPVVPIIPDVVAFISIQHKKNIAACYPGMDS